jgi:methionyl-tRNA formyltransferase
MLYDRNVLSLLAVENGISIPPESTFASPNSSKLISNFVDCIQHPLRIVYQFHNLICHRRYYGHRSYHDKRILQHSFEIASPDLPIYHFANINSEETVDSIRGYAPDLLFVFGTRLIDKVLIQGVKAPIVNIHWGWSPRYRGEGIVSALAYGGPEELGVTVHVLDNTIDGGDILYRERIQSDERDNFYSIGLKLTKTGIGLFVRVFEDFKRRGFLSGTRQDLSQGRLYSGEYMRQHPEMYRKAWINLKKEKQTC